MLSGVLFCLPCSLINTHIPANCVVVGVVITAGIIVGDDIGLGRIGLPVSKAIVDFVYGRIVSAKAVEGSANVLGRIHRAEAIFCGKVGFDNPRVGHSIEVTCENVRKRRLADILEQKCRLYVLRGRLFNKVDVNIVKAERLVVCTVDELGANVNARAIALPHSLKQASGKVFIKCEPTLAEGMKQKTALAEGDGCALPRVVIFASVTENDIFGESLCEKILHLLTDLLKTDDIGIFAADNLCNFGFTIAEPVIAVNGRADAHIKRHYFNWSGHIFFSFSESTTKW